MRAPWTKGAHAYPMARSFADAAEYYKRVRKNFLRYYILDDDAPELQTEKCAYCKRLMPDPPPSDSGAKDTGNRAIYSPKLKKSVVLHYYCSWQSLMEDIFQVPEVERLSHSVSLSN